MRRMLGLLAGIILLMTSTTALASCTTSATTLAFGNVTFSTVNSTSTVTVNCTRSASFTVTLSTGNGGSFSPRQMSSGTNHLNYNIYADSARTQIWGSGASGTVANSGSTPNGGGTVNFTAYGQVPAQSSAAPGSYTDTITVTVTY